MAGSSSVWLSLIRSALADIDPRVLIREPGSLDEETKKLLAGPQFLSGLLLGFSVFATLLTIVGTYGVAAYAAQQRRREVAIRIALGASSGAIVRQLLRESGLTLLAGI